MKVTLLILLVLVVQSIGIPLMQTLPGSSAGPSYSLVVAATGVIGAFGAAVFVAYRRRLVPVRTRK
jgi:hypothetical protein